MNENRRGRIAARAHQIWEAEGRPRDKAEEHWRRAEQEVAREERSGQMGEGAQPDVDRRPEPPVDAAPPLEGADTAPAAPDTAARKSKRKVGRTRGARSNPQQS